jgi:regulatory protein
MLALPYAVKLLAGRDKSEASLRAALDKKAYAAHDIDAAIARLKTLGYLNETRFAQTKTRALLLQGKTPADIRQRLERDGLTAQLIDSVVSQEAAAAGYDPLQAARALLAKKRVTGAKAARFLASRGFDEELIRRLVTSLDE